MKVINAESVRGVVLVEIEDSERSRPRGMGHVEIIKFVMER